MSSDKEMAPPHSEASLHDQASQHADFDTEKAGSAAGDEEEDEKFEKQPLMTVVLLTVTSLMAMFLIALDRTIITTV